MSDNDDDKGNDANKAPFSELRTQSDKTIDASSSLLKKTLTDLKHVKAKEDQHQKVTKINKILATLHGDKSEHIQNIKDQAHEKSQNYHAKMQTSPSLFKRYYYDVGRMLNSFKAKHYEIYDFIRSAFYALFLAMFIRSLIIQPFNIPSESMVPSLLVGDYIFVDKSAYGYSKYSFPFAPDLFEGRIFSTMPERGDVAVFRVVDDQNKDYIKRIVGLPGDKIQYIDGRLWVNGAQVPVKMLGPYDGRPLDPSAYNAPVFEETLDGKTYQTLDIYDGLPTDNTPIFEVPEGHFFVTGDNRDKSQDSRLMNGPVGFVPMDRLIGKAEIIFFSLDRANFLEVWKWPTAIRFNRIFKNID